MSLQLKCTNTRAGFNLAVVKRRMQVIAILMACVLPLDAIATEVSKSVMIDAATLVVFAPPSMPAETDDGSAEALAHLQFAVEDTQRCLKPKKIKLVHFFADVVVVRNGAKVETFPVHRLDQAIGGILVEPGRDARLVVSEVGPSSLQRLLPDAAADYWGAKACRNYRGSGGE